MPDIALAPVPGTLSSPPVIDIILTDPPSETVAIDVQTDDGLSTAVLISLFTDGRAEPELASDQADLRGWWGDEFGPIGSRLWQLSRAKLTEETLQFARAEATAALRWLVDANIASQVDCTVTRSGLFGLVLSVRIQRPAEPDATFRYALNWAATES